MIIVASAAIKGRTSKKNKNKKNSTQQIGKHLSSLFHYFIHFKELVAQ